MIYSDEAKTARLNAVVTLLAGGSLAILNASNGLLVSFALAGASVSGSGTVILSLSGVPLSAIAASSGTAAKGELRKSGGAVVVSNLSVGTLGTEVVLTSTTIVAGTNITLTSGVITHG